MYTRTDALLRLFFRHGKRTPKRWYVSPETDEKEAIGVNFTGGFDALMPAEWESWLRHRRYAFQNI